MASIAKMSIMMGWDGKPAEAGLARTEKGLKSTQSAAEATTSTWQKLAGAFKGAADIKAGLGLVTGAAQSLIMAPIRALSGIVQLGGQLETLQIRMGYLAGGFKEGNQALDQLRDTSLRTGIPLENLAKAFTELTSMGLSSGATTALLRDTAAAVNLLGGGAAGAERLAGSFGQLMTGATASEGALMGLQTGGLKAFEALGQRLEKLTGRTFTAREAMEALQKGTVLSGTALQAIQDAANSPEAAQANERFLLSFEGKLQEAKNAATETFRDIGKILLDTFKVTEALAGFKGFILGIRDIILEIGKTFQLMADPLEKAGGVEASFKLARNLAYDIGETLAKAGVEVFRQFKLLLTNIETMAKRVQIILEEGATGYLLGYTEERLAELEKQATLEEARGIMDAAGQEQKIRDFFGGMRNTAAAADVAAEAAKKAAQAQAAQAKAAEGVAEGANAAKAALELSRQNIKDWSRETLEATATPLEKLKQEFKVLGDLVAQSAQVGLDLTQEEIAKFQEAVGRRGARALQEFITAGESPDSYQATAATKGSAQAVEAIIRNRFGPESQDVQTRIEQAAVRNAALAEKQLEIQKKQLAALARIPNPPAILAFPKK